MREAAIAIANTTDAQGFASMTTENTGGWTATMMGYSFGSRVENEEGTKATIDTPAMGAAMQYFHDLRWKDNVFGDNFLLNFSDASQPFAAGKIGMFLQVSETYPRMVDSLRLSRDALGIGPMPQTANGIGTMGAAGKNPSGLPWWTASRSPITAKPPGYGGRCAANRGTAAHCRRYCARSPCISTGRSSYTGVGTEPPWR